MRRFGKPEDIAALALFLCSERARHVQGTAIAVDGGATLAIIDRRHICEGARGNLRQPPEIDLMRK